MAGKGGNKSKTAKVAEKDKTNVGKTNATSDRQDTPAAAVAAAEQVVAAVTNSLSADRVQDAPANPAPEHGVATTPRDASPDAATPTAPAAEDASRARTPQAPKPNVVVERKKASKPRSPPTPLPITKSLANAINLAAHNTKRSGAPGAFAWSPSLLQVGGNIPYCYGMQMLSSEHNICAIRCRTSFRHAEKMYNFERGWTRPIINASPHIFFVECPGSNPLVICAGFKDSPVQGGVGVGANGVASNRNEKSREAVLSRIITVSRPALQVTLNVAFPEESTKRTPCEVHGTAAAMAALEKCIEEEGREHAHRRHRAEAPGQGMVSSITARFRGNSATPPQDPTLPYHPGWYKSKNCYIDGLVRATVHLTDAQMQHFRNTPGLLIMPVRHVIEYDEKVDERQLTIRFKGNIDVGVFHNIVVEKLCRNAEYEAFASYVTYATLCVTLNKPVSRATLRAIVSMLKKETTDLSGSWFLMPNSDKLPSEWEQKAAALPRTRFLPNEPIVQQEALVRRTVAISTPVDPAFLAAIAKELGFTLVAARECDFSVTPLRFVGEWPTVEQAKKMEGEDNARRIQVGDFNFVLEVLSPLDEQRV
jgi:hypothetical protein